MEKIFNGKNYLMATGVVQVLFWSSLLTGLFTRVSEFDFLDALLRLIFFACVYMIIALVPLGIILLFMIKTKKRKHALVGLLVNLSLAIFVVWISNYQYYDALRSF